MNLARALVQRAKAGSSKRLIVTRILLKALEAPSCFRMSTGIILYFVCPSSCAGNGLRYSVGKIESVQYEKFWRENNDKQLNYQGVKHSKPLTRYS